VNDGLEKEVNMFEKNISAEWGSDLHGQSMTIRFVPDYINVKVLSLGTI